MGEMLHDMDRLQDWLGDRPARPGVGEMSFRDWIGAPINWVFLVVGLLTLLSAVKVVTAKNVVHAALFLVAALGGTAILFLMLSAEFVAWVVVLVYIGAVLVLFLFGIMITRPRPGRTSGSTRQQTLARPALERHVPAPRLGVTDAFGTTEIVDLGEATSTEVPGLALLGRFVIPFEVVSLRPPRCPDRWYHHCPTRPEPSRRGAAGRGPMLLNQFLILAAAMFSLGIYGLLVRRNIVLILLSSS